MTELYAEELKAPTGLMASPPAELAVWRVVRPSGPVSIARPPPAEMVCIARVEVGMAPGGEVAVEVTVITSFRCGQGRVDAYLNPLGRGQRQV